MVESLRPLLRTRKRSSAVFWAALLVSGTACVSAQDEPPERPGAEREVQGVQIGGLELSGAALVEGGLLLIDDEQVGAMMVVDAASVKDPAKPLVARQVKLERRRRSSRPYTKLPRLFAVQDLEDLASDGEDTVYVLGSHAGRIGREGVDRRPDREFIIRAKWDADDRELKVRSKHDKDGKRGLYTGLIEELERARPGMAEAFVNAEGLALKGKQDLFVGLRSPLTKEKKALVFTTRVDHLFGDDDDRQALTKGEPMGVLELDLAGGAVRGLHWDRERDRLLILSGPPLDAIDETFALWAYDPESKSLERVRRFAPAFVLANGAPEGVCRLDASTVLVAFDREGAQGGGLFRVPYPGDAGK